jgi:inner membrane protein
MDNLCHSLVGAALASAGLARRTRLATATLVIGANFPDIDVIAVPLGGGLGFRRGWTHGVPAMLVLPFVLTGIMLWWDRRTRRRRVVLGRDPSALPPTSARALLLLSFVSILTHPALDLMNTYGVRLLMPFSERWFYGDSLFIVDPWLWALLLAAYLLGRRGAEQGTRRARVALAAAGAYVFVMIGLGAWTRMRVDARLRETLGAPVTLMVAPVPVNPFRRDVVYQHGQQYALTSTSVFTSRPDITPRMSIAMHRDDPIAERATTVPAVRTFLSWSRFPYFEIDRDATGFVVQVSDARYARPGGQSWASITVHLTRPIAPGPVSTRVRSDSTE